MRRTAGLHCCRAPLNSALDLLTAFGEVMDLALFDFDGTITTREMLPDFFRSVVPTPRLIVGQIILAPLIIGYKLGFVSGVKVRTTRTTTRTAKISDAPQSRRLAGC